MDEKLLISCGLSHNQARAYKALILRKSLKPTELSKFIGESRTNCYAILDRLVELELATKVDDQKKYTYFPTSPLALKSLIESKRKAVEEQLIQLDRKMPQMLSAFELGGEAPKLKHFKGKSQLESMYKEQLTNGSKELFFVRSKADVPYFGQQKMLDIRFMSANYKTKRYGITPITYYVKPLSKTDKKAGRLDRAWVFGDEYTSKVEWAVSGSKVHAILMEGDGYGLEIEHPEIAKSFMEILSLLHKYIKQRPDYDRVLKQSKYDQLASSVDD